MTKGRVRDEEACWSSINIQSCSSDGEYRTPFHPLHTIRSACTPFHLLCSPSIRCTEYILILSHTSLNGGICICCMECPIVVYSDWHSTGHLPKYEILSMVLID